MIKVIAIDDEPLALKQLETYISKVPFFSIAASCSNALEAREYLEDNDADAMFLDINMPDISGLEFVRMLPKKPLIVFTTAHPQYAIEGFKTDAVDYLLKPFSFSEFLTSAEKVKTRLEQIRAVQESTAGTRSDDFVFFKMDYKIIKVNVNDIIYAESMSEYIKIHLESEKTPMLVLMSIPKLLGKLPQNMFARTHRSYMVNLSKIKEVSKGIVLLENGKIIPVGDNWRKELHLKL